MNKINMVVGEFKTTVKGVGSEDTRITIEGYANTVVKDRSGDVVLQEAWEKGALNNYLKNPILLFDHNYSEPAGEIVDYNVDNMGLYIVAEVSKAAGKVFDLVKDGVLKAFSIGFTIKDAVYDKVSDVFYIKDLELYEISIVSVPANQDSIFSLRKSLESSDYEALKTLYTEEETVVTSTKLTNLAEEKSADISKEIPNMSATVVDTGAERLLKEIETRLASQETSFAEAIKGLQADLAEKSAELRAIQESKMRFNEREAEKGIPSADKETAVLLAKAMGRAIKDTRYGSRLVEKVGAHLATAGAEWENVLSTNIYNEMRNRLVVEPLFRTINMNSATMQIPYSGNPLGSDASWVNPSALGTNNSTGTAVAHVLSDLTMTVKKIAAKDSLLDEEEEDAILPILPIIRDSLVTRIARKVDNTLLLSDGLTGDWAYAFAGLAKFATNASATDASVSAANGSVDATDVHKLRIKLGTYGTSPSDVIYIISVDAYYDLLNDASSGLTTVDTYGPNATLMKGEIGSLWGSKVLVSNEFAAKAQGAAWGIAVNASNFLKGELRGLNVESERTVESQKRIIVATRRIGFLQMTTNKGVAAGVYGA